MPTVLRIGSFRFYFFSNEGQEPAHIHGKAAEDQAKSWLDSVVLAVNHGFSARELSELARIIIEHRTEVLKAWNDYFSQ